MSEGDPENEGAAGANSPARLIHALRQRGHELVGLDAELYGWRRALVAARTFSPSRPRWVGRFHLHPVAFRARTACARALLGAITPRPDAIIQFGTAMDAALPGVPLLVWADTCSEVTLGEPFSWIGAMPPAEQAAVVRQERALFARIARMMPWSDYSGRAMVARAGVDASKVRVTYVGTSIEIADATAARAARGDAGPLRLLFVGREFARKGGDVLLEAAGRLVARGIDLRVTVIGPQRLDGLPPFVDFLGFLDKNRAEDKVALDRAYAEADVFCLPTRREPFGIAVAEAMFSGLPVVATRLSAIPEMVDEGVTGFTIAVDDVDALTDRLAALASDAPLRRAMGAAGRARALSTFTWGEVAHRVESALMEVVPTR